MPKNRIFILCVAAILLCHCGGGGGDSGGGAGSGGGGSDATGAINLAWEASPDSAAVGHLVYYGTRAGSYEYIADAGATPGAGATVLYTLRGLTKGQTYYIAVTAYDRDRNESDFSNEESGVAK